MIPNVAARRLGAAARDVARRRCQHECRATLTTHARNVAFVFPGQGAQHVGMARDVYQTFRAARQLMDEADAVVGGGLTQLMFDGPQQQLTLTENAQPAILLHSIALVHVMRTEFGIDVRRSCAAMLGHSLGEYTALLAAGSLSLGDALQLVRLRGQEMQRVADALGQPTTMQAVVTWGDHAADIERVLPEIQAALARTGDVAHLANVNGRTQVVLSGTLRGVEHAAHMLQTRHYAGRAITLPVSAPFHCPLMAPAADALRGALARVELRPPAVDVISNVTARPMPREPAAVRALLGEQMTATVQWDRCISHCLQRGVKVFFVVGPSRALSNLLRKELPSDARVIPLVTAADLQANAAQLNRLRDCGPVTELRPGGASGSTAAGSAATVA